MTIETTKDSYELVTELAESRAYCMRLREAMRECRADLIQMHAVDGRVAALSKAIATIDRVLDLEQQ